MGAFMRFYNLDWGYGNFFHPDERNIGMAVANIRPEAGDFNPDFFAYGSFPIYMIYTLSGGDFSLSIQYGRMLSALFSTLSLPLIYLITKRLLVAVVSSEKHGIKDETNTDKYALMALIIAAFSPGLIQFAHFTTFESFLTFEYLLFCYFSIKLLEKPTWRNYLILAVICGLAVGTKIVSLFLVPIYLLVHLIVILAKRKPEENRIEFVKKFPLKLFQPNFIVSLVLIFVVFVLSNPFIFLDYDSFIGSLNYESAVARGTLPVFYTQQFIETVPFFYQLTYVFPSILSWPLTILGILAIFFLTIYSTRYFLVYIFKNTNRFKLPLLIFLLVSLGYGAFHMIMFVKWSRYMIPLVPFLIIATILLLVNFIFKKKSSLRLIAKVTLYFVYVFAIIQGTNFFTIYLKPDPRIEAAEWLKSNSSEDAQYAAEVYDIGMTAFNAELGYGRITEFDYYHLDDEFTSDNRRQELDKLMSEVDFVIVPSERIYPTRARLPEIYPVGYDHYQRLFNEELGFVKVAEFTRTTYLEDLLGFNFYNAGLFMPLNYDETFRVFDQPTVTIFSRSGNL